MRKGKVETYRASENRSLEKKTKQNKKKRQGAPPAMLRCNH